MRKEAKGSVTVMLSLVLLLVLALLLGLLESACMQAARAQLLTNADLGMFSLLAEYDSSLLEGYEVLFLDGGKGTTQIQTAVMEDRLAYFSGGKQEGREVIQIGRWNGMNVQQAKFTSVMRATDYGGFPFFHQAVAYAKEILIRRLWEGDSGTIGNSLEMGADLFSQADSVSGGIEAIREMAKQQKKEEHERKKAQAKEQGLEYNKQLDLTKYEFENPIDAIKSLMKMNVSQLAGVPISKKQVNSNSLLSNREYGKGWGEFEFSTEISPVDGIWFNTYILEKLPCLVSESTEDEALQYQCEYVLAGMDTDEKNLEAVLKKILFIRFGINFAMILTSAARVSEAEALAMSIASAAALPALQPLLKTAFLLLWALEDSIEDIKTLCSGGSVKWTENDQKGMDYRGYLEALLLVTSLDQRIYRCMDMVEHSVRIRLGREKFCMDTMVFAVKAEISAQIRPLFLLSYGTDNMLSTRVSGSYYTN